MTLTTYDPIALLFSGMEKLGPGDNAHTSHVLRLLPKRQFRVVVDAGCGTGRQTFVLAKELGVVVHAIDSHKPFLDELVIRAREENLERLVQSHCMDMNDIPSAFQDIDLLWSEGAAYNIGFPNALATWKTAMVSGGFAVVSELCWLKEQAPPGDVEAFFRCGYPDMRSVQQTITIAEEAGFKVLATHTLPEEAWMNGYYDILHQRAKALAGHPDSSVRDLAAETIREIEIFGCSNGSYGYVFFALERA